MSYTTYLTYNMDLSQFNLNSGANMPIKGLITDKVQNNPGVVYIEEDSHHIILNDIQKFKNIDLCGSPWIASFYDKSSDDYSNFLKTFWDAYSYDLAEINMHKTYNLTIAQSKNFLKNFDLNKIKGLEHTVFYLGMLENRLYLEHLFLARELNAKWIDRYNKALNKTITENEFKDWLSELDQIAIREYFDSIPINYDLHEEYVKTIDQFLLQEVS